MIKQYQVTLFCSTGQYKPVSTIVKKDDCLLTEKGEQVFFKEIKIDGIKKICIQRYWNSKDLKKYHYDKVKIREYKKSNSGGCTE